MLSRAHKTLLAQIKCNTLRKGVRGWLFGVPTSREYQLLYESKNKFAFIHNSGNDMFLFHNCTNRVVRCLSPVASKSCLCGVKISKKLQTLIALYRAN